MEGCGSESCVQNQGCDGETTGGNGESCELVAIRIYVKLRTTPHKGESIKLFTFRLNPTFETTSNNSRAFFSRILTTQITN